MVRHEGNPEQPQKRRPALGPRLVVRSTMSLPHLGHLRAAVGSSRDLSARTCSRFVDHDGEDLPDSITPHTAFTYLFDSMGSANDLTYLAKPKPTVTFLGIRVFNFASPTKAITDGTESAGSDSEASASSTALTCR